MHLIRRNYQGEDDYNRIRVFLSQVFLLNDRRMLSWPAARLDYWRWHGINNLGHGSLEKNVFLWETEDGQIASVLNSEGPGHAFLQVHPSYKTSDLEEVMIIQAEEHLRTPCTTGGMRLKIWTEAGDAQRIEILQRRGFVHDIESDEHQWRRNLELPIPEYPVGPGFTIRPLEDMPELAPRSWASWRAFHADEADENYDGDWKWYLNIQSAPLYRPELDLVAVTPAGEVAAFTTIWFEEQTKCGYFEPVGTMPEFQRRGLARSLLCEGMRRLRRMGTTQCMTSGGSHPANALYQAMFGPVYDLFQPWEKRWS